MNAFIYEFLYHSDNALAITVDNHVPLRLTHLKCF